MNTTFIAEISSNHNQDLDRCFAFVDKAAEIGCDAIKFQLFKVEELFALEALHGNDECRKRKAWELPLSFLSKLAERCRKRNIQFGCTPFYLDAVSELYQYVDFYKVASYELLWSGLLVACAKTGKPVVISTGMATLDEVESAVATLIEAGCKNLTILHCVSGYPAPVNECNLAAIDTIRKTISQKLSDINLHFGWSDHSVSPGVMYRAVHRWGAEMIEFHLDLDGRGEEYKTGHCWLPEHIKTVIENIRSGFQADGAGKKIPTSVELTEREWRADPADGLRPLRETRKKING